MSQDVKRWETISIDTKLPGTRIDIDGVPRILVMPVTEHEAVVAKLKAEADHLNRQLADAMSGCCDCPMFKAQGKTVAELRAENEILKSKASQFESTLKETMRVRDAEIEKLKRVVDVLKIQRCRLLSEKFAGFPLNAMNAESELDAELDAIGKGEV